MHEFIDFYKNKVTLSFQDHPFSDTPKHVWIICLYKNKWLLTKHKERGLEFPGGKVEKGETAEAAAIREVKEETGALIKDIYYVGQYYVAGKRDQVIKNVYFANIQSLLEQETYYETDGPVLMSQLPQNLKKNPTYSFMMKDDVLTHCLLKIKKQFNI